MSVQQEKEVYKWVLNQGVDIIYGKLSLCDLRNYRHSDVKTNRRYQVHCEDNRCEWSKIYFEIEPAIMKFMELKKKARRIK